MAACNLLGATLLLILFQICLGNFVHERRAVNLDVLKAVYEKKSVQTKIEEGIFGLPENIERKGQISVGKDELDCNLRYLAYNYSKKLLSPSANIKAVADGLQLSSLCGISPKVPKQEKYWEHEKQILEIKSHRDFLEFFVDAKETNFRGMNDGSKEFPFTKIEEALKACEFKRPNTEVHCIIRLREGIHFLQRTLQLTSKHSNVLITR